MTKTLIAFAGGEPTYGYLVLLMLGLLVAAIGIGWLVSRRR